MQTDEQPVVINPDAFVARKLFAPDKPYRWIKFRTHPNRRKAPRLLMCYWCRTGKHAQCPSCGCSCRRVRAQ